MQLPPSIPLFPLPDHVLLPGIPTAYRIFEPRYRALVVDLLAQPEDARWLVIPHLCSGWQEASSLRPAFHPIAVAAMVRRIVAEPAPEFHIVVEGLLRCHLTEQESHKAYRLARPERVPDLPDDMGDLSLALKEMLGRLASQGSGFSGQFLSVDPKLVDGVDPLLLLDRIAGIVIPTSVERQEWLECRYVSRRLALLEATIDRRRGDLPPDNRMQWQPSSN